MGPHANRIVTRCTYLIDARRCHRSSHPATGEVHLEGGVHRVGRALGLCCSETKRNSLLLLQQIFNVVSPVCSPDLPPRGEFYPEKRQ